MKRLLNITAIIAALFIAGCGGDDGPNSSGIEIKLIPFQYEINGKWGYADTQGNKVIDTLFEIEPGFFKDGYALVKNWDGSVEYIDEKGKSNGVKYLDATLFFEGLACVVDGGGIPKYINKKFKTVFEMKDAVYTGVFSESLARFQNKEGKWGFVDTLGKIAIKPQFDYATNFNEGLAIATSKTSGTENVFFIDKTGKKVIEFKQSLKNLGVFYDGVAAFADSLTWGLIDKNGETLSLDTKDWTFISDMNNGYASFQKNGKWGLIDNKGKIVIDADYSKPIAFIGGLSSFEQDKKFGFININKEIEIKPEYDAIAIPFFSGFAAVKKGNDFFLIDKSGKLLNEKPFKNISFNYFDLADKEKYVESRVFDVKEIISKIISKLSDTEIIGFTKGMTFDDVVKKFRADKSKIDMEGNSINIPFAKFSADIGISFVIYFDKPLNSVNPQPQFKSLEIMLALTGPENKTKVEMVVNELKRRLSEAGFEKLGQREGVIKYINKNSEAALTVMNAQIGFLFELK